MSLRLAFMGSPDFSVPALKALHESGHDIVAVYTQPPRGTRGAGIRNPGPDTEKFPQ
jgi:methionyl-tRNA formyltransferase